MKLPEPFTFFIDRALGKDVLASALRAAGHDAIAGDVHFAQNAPDVDWLPVVGQRGWVMLTKDKAIRTNKLERDALISNNVAAFMLTSGSLPGAEMARIFLAAMRSMHRALRRYNVPFIAYVTPAATVSIVWADGEWVVPPKKLK